jgi:hypothetical protein
MKPISDAFLLNVAEVSATLVGLFLVGVFFYVETGFRRLDSGVRNLIEPYMQAGTRIVLVLFALPLFLSLTLVALGPNWNRVVFAAFCVLLLAANADSLLRIRPLMRARESPVLLVNEVAGSVLVLVLVVTPWALGGIDPSREDLTWAILLSFASGLLSVSALVLSVFDMGPR